MLSPSGKVMIVSRFVRPWILTLLQIPFLGIFVFASRIILQSHPSDPSRFWSSISWTVAFGYLAFSIAHALFSQSDSLRIADQSSYLILPFYLIAIQMYPYVPSVRWLFQALFLLTFLWKSYTLFRGIIPRMRMNLGRRSWKPIVFTFVLVSLMPLSSLHDLTTPLDGDEPYFLLISHSLIYDGDIDLTNEYIGEASRNFMERSLVPQEYDAFRQGQMRSRHSPFLPILLIPGFGLHGRLGAVWTMNALAALLTVVLVDLLFLLTGKLKPSLIAGILIVSTSPTLLYSFRIYTEIPAALLALICLRSAIRSPKRLVTMIAINAFVGIWKTRFLALTLPIAIFGMMLRKLNPKRVLIVISSAMFFLTLLLGVNTLVFGSPLIRYSFADLTGTSLYRLARGTLGLLWDVQYGLFPLNPMMIAATLGIPVMLRHLGTRRSIIWSSFLPYFIIIAAYSELIGGICPRGRFNLAWSIFLAVPLAFFIHYHRSVVSRVILTSGSILSLMITWISIFDPDLQIELPGAASRTLSLISQRLNMDILGFLPSFDRPYGPHLMIGSTASLLLATGAMFYSFRPKRTLQPSPLLVFPYVLVTILVIPLVCYLTGPTLESDWMDTEDVTFKRSSDLFWEEPFRWDYSRFTTQPYFAGVRLEAGGRIERDIAMRGHGTTLEIRARANCPKQGIPLLSIRSGDRQSPSIMILSDLFRSYYLDLPEEFNPDHPQLILENASMRTESGNDILIDRIRLVENTPDHAAQAVADRFPVRFGELLIDNVGVTDSSILQGTAVQIRIDVARATDATMDCIVRFSKRLSAYDHHFDPQQGLNDLVIVLPEDLGTGDFCLSLLVMADGQTLPPEASGAFETGSGIWIGSIRVLPRLLNADPDVCDRLRSSHPNWVTSPYRAILGGGDRIEIPVGVESCTSIMLISTLRHVYECIPFREQIASFELKPSTTGHSLIPIIIGEHTAESMYELPIENLRLAHGTPAVFSRTPAQVVWPPAISGLAYEDLLYESEIRLPEKQDIDSISLNVTNPMSAFDLRALAFRKDQP